MSKHILILATDQEESNKAEILIRALLEPLQAFTSIKHSSITKFETNIGLAIDLWSIETWDEMHTCGMTFDEIIYFCKPPRFIKARLAACDAKLHVREEMKEDG